MASQGRKTSNSSNRKPNLAPANIQKQVQAAIAVSCMTYVSSLETTKLPDVHQKHFYSYHGNPVSGILPMVKDCLAGEGSFGDLLDRIDNGSDGSAAQLTLKTHMSQKGHILYRAGESLTIQSLSNARQMNPILISGRAIFAMAQAALKNGKKALFIEKAAYNSAGLLPSGWNDEDLDKHILDEMWKLLKGPKVHDVDVEEIEDENDPSDEHSNASKDDTTLERPEGWIFQGWFAYRLLGPRAHPDFQTHLFSNAQHTFSTIENHAALQAA